MADAVVAKREARRRWRAARAQLVQTAAASPSSGLGARSRRIVSHLVALEPVASAERVMAYRSVPGEVDVADLFEWGGANGVEVLAPAADPDAAPPCDPSWPDVVVVPALAVTADGRRLGQGGGWYDRFLADRRPDTFVVGACFREFVASDLPTDAHDVRLDCVVTDDGPLW